MCDHPDCHATPEDHDLPFPRLSGTADPDTLPDGRPRIITAHFEPDTKRYGSH